jgi:hypothetical protein
VEFVVTMLVLAAVVAVIAAPLRRGREPDAVLEAGLASLEAAKEAKHDEIRDAELDFRTGKLSEAEHRALDHTLRAEAIALNRRLDVAREAAAERSRP